MQMHAGVLLVVLGLIIAGLGAKLIAVGVLQSQNYIRAFTGSGGKKWTTNSIIKIDPNDPGPSGGWPKSGVVRAPTK